MFSLTNLFVSKKISSKSLKWSFFILFNNWVLRGLHLPSPFPTFFSSWVKCCCGMACRELLTPFLCLKPVKAAVRNSATASHQAVPLAAGALKLSSKLNDQKLWLSFWGSTFSKILESTFKNVLITSKLMSHLSNFCHFLKRKIACVSDSVRFPIRSDSSTRICIFNFLNTWFSWI